MIGKKHTNVLPRMPLSTNIYFSLQEVVSYSSEYIQHTCGNSPPYSSLLQTPWASQLVPAALNSLGCGCKSIWWSRAPRLHGLQTGVHLTFSFFSVRLLTTYGVLLVLRGLFQR